MKRQLFCDVCASTTDHMIENGDDDGDEMALCLRCGRLHSAPRDQMRSSGSGKAGSDSPCSTPCRDR